MNIKLLKTFLLCAMLAFGFAQQPPPSSTGDQLTAREMFYKESPGDDKLPPLPPPRKRVVIVPAKVPPPSRPPVAMPDAAIAQRSPASAGTVRNVSDVPVPPVEHLGLRYRVLLVDPATNQATAVDSDGVFHSGDCLALELEPNRSGYLYVLAKESNGNWHPLFPSSEMQGESEVVHARTKERAPQKYCFELDQNAGEEHLYVILSRNPAQVQDLHDSLVHDFEPEKAPAAPAPATVAVMADAAVFNREASDMITQLGSRGFKIAKAGASESADEKYSVFVVPAKLEKKDTVFADIRIKHR